MAKQISMKVVNEDYDPMVCQGAMFISLGGTDHVGLYLEIVKDRLLVYPYQGIHQASHVPQVLIFNVSELVEEARKFESREENEDE